MTSKDTSRLLRALEKRRETCYVPSHQVTMAAIILQINGIEAALKYVAGLPDSKPPLESAFEFFLQEESHRIRLHHDPGATDASIQKGYYA